MTRRALSMIISLVLLTSFLAVLGHSPAHGDESTDDRVRMIIMAEPEPARDPGTQQTTAQQERQRDRIRANHDQLVRAARANGIRLEQLRSLTDLVNGVVVSVERSRVKDLASVPGVAAVHPDLTARAQTDSSVDLIGAPKVWEQEDPDGVPVRGTGSVVAVIDSGIDYTHPSLGGGIGEGRTVIGGHDFVNDDDDPADDNGHGTHVAGIIAGNGDITGTAPEASLVAYKALDQRGSGYASDVIAALEAAVAPGPLQADVINLSLGVPGDGTDPLSQAATRAVRLGAVVVSSAGNTGPGDGTMTSPAVADGVISVGASTSGVRVPSARMVAPEDTALQTFRVPFSANPEGSVGTGELVDVGRGTAADYERVGDISGKVVAYQERLPSDVTDVSAAMLKKAKLAEDRGAIAVLGHSGGSGPVLAPTESGHPSNEFRTAASAATVEDPQRMESLVVLGLQPGQWEELSGHLASGPVSVRIGTEDLTDQVASFSARGPAPDYGVGPDLVAPGVEILSTFPTDWVDAGAYRMSGTSMAAPHVAGAAALLHQLAPKESAGDLTSRLTGSAKALSNAPMVAGAGRLDVAAAARSSVLATPTAIDLGLAATDDPRLREVGTVELRNSSSRPQVLDLTTKAAPDSIGQAVVSPSRVSLPPGGTAKVNLAVTAETPAHEADLTGWVVATPRRDGEPSTRVPYLLAVRPLLVQASPDPTDGSTTVLVHSPATLAHAPTLRIEAPDGGTDEVATTLDHGSWYRAAVSGPDVGPYAISATATTTGKISLTGTGAFEVVANQDSGADRWHPIGPNQTGGELTTVPDDPDFLGLEQYLSHSPWLSRDQGETWRQQAAWPVTGGTSSLAVDPTDTETMWLGLAGGDADPTYRGKILRTRDGGDSWQPLDVADVPILDLVIHPSGDVLVAVTPTTLLVSRDRGQNWAEHAQPIGSAVRDTYFGGDDLYLASSDAVWQVPALGRGAPGAATQVLDEQTDSLVADEHLVAVLTRGTDEVLGSTDGGRTWQSLFTVPDKNGFYLRISDGELMVSTYGDFQWMSADHGATWTEVAEPIDGDIENDFARLGDDELLFSSPGAGLFHTDGDGTNAQRIGVQGGTVKDLAITEGPAGDTLLAGTERGMASTELPTDAEFPTADAEWGLTGGEARVGLDYRLVQSAPGADDVVWRTRNLAMGQFEVERSTDGAQTWQVRGSSAIQPFDLGLTAADPDRVLIPYQQTPEQFGILATSDAGGHWRKLFHGPAFTAVAIDPENADRVWLGSPDGLYRSDDFGETVHRVRTEPATSIAVVGDQVIVGGNDIALSNDDGESFTEADTGGLSLSVTDLVAAPDDSSVRYAAAGGHRQYGLPRGGRGVLRSTDGGATWHNLSGGLQNLDVQSLAISPDGDWLYAGTREGGVHRLSLG